MPPIQQQQTSRGGLITALVIAIVFFVGALVWGVMSNADSTKFQNELKVQQAKYDKVIPASSLQDIDNIRTQLSSDPNQARAGSLIDAFNDQRRSQLKLIYGKPEGSEKDAAEDAAAAIKEIKANPALAGVAIPEGSGLTGVIRALAKRATDDADAVAKAKADAAAAQASLTAAIAAQQAELAKRDEAVKAAQAEAAKATADATAAIAEKDKQVADAAKKADDAVKAQGDAEAKTVVEMQTRDRKIAELTGKLEASNNKLAQFRPNVKDAMIRNVDAVITQISPDSIAYINLGFGDHVSPGLTFEVYDKHDGVPKLGDGTDPLNMPKGKASVEIISVGQNSSQVRVLNATQGTTVSQGDLCVNVVYDRNIKPYFFVYGKFDMDQNGVATEAEGETIKSLITRWGGKVSDKISIESDFVVLGKEPVIPLFTPEELTQPIPKAKSDEAKAALDAYNKIRDEAVALHIPVLNQNRFLYYTGYFDAAKK
jgi:hypothetical protein